MFHRSVQTLRATPSLRFGCTKAVICFLRVEALGQHEEPSDGSPPLLMKVVQPTHVESESQHKSVSLCPSKGGGCVRRLDLWRKMIAHLLNLASANKTTTEAGLRKKTVFRRLQSFRQLSSTLSRSCGFGSSLLSFSRGSGRCLQPSTASSSGVCHPS